MARYVAIATGQDAATFGALPPAVMHLQGATPPDHATGGRKLLVLRLANGTINAVLSGDLTSNGVEWDRREAYYGGRR